MRYKVVQADAWQRLVANVFFQSNDEEESLRQANLLQEKHKVAFQVVDSWDPAYRSMF